VCARAGLSSPDDAGDFANVLLMMADLYRPADLGSVSGDEVGRFYANYLREVELARFDATERAYLENPNILGRVVDPGTRSFFVYHVGASIARVVRALVEGRSRPRLVELGCGSGSVALLLALGGARVIGIDRNPVAVAACRRRQALYESQFGSLALEFHLADAVTFRYGPCDGAYSVFAFNLMRPTPALLDGVVPALGPGGRFVLADGNKQSIVNHMLRRHAGPSLRELQAALDVRGLIVSEVRFGGLIPPFFARSTPTRRLVEKVECRLASSGLLGWAAASYTLVAEKPPLSAPRREASVKPVRRLRRAPATRPLSRRSKSPQRSPDRLRRVGGDSNRRVRLSHVWGAFSVAFAASAAVTVAAVCALADVCLVGFCC